MFSDDFNVLETWRYLDTVLRGAVDKIYFDCSVVKFASFDSDVFATLMGLLKDDSQFYIPNIEKVSDVLINNFTKSQEFIADVRAGEKTLGLCIDEELSRTLSLENGDAVFKHQSYLLKQLGFFEEKEQSVLGGGGFRMNIFHVPLTGYSTTKMRFYEDYPLKHEMWSRSPDKFHALVVTKK